MITSRQSESHEESRSLDPGMVYLGISEFTW